MATHSKASTSGFKQLMESDCTDYYSSSDENSTCSDCEPELQKHESDANSESESDDNVENDCKQTIKEHAWKYVVPKTEDIQQKTRSGTLTARSENFSTLKECFDLFISHEIVDSIVTHTNEKAQKMCAKGWKPVDREEIHAVFGLLLLIGRFKESQEAKDDLWRRNAALSRPIYAAVMSRDRFRQILSYMRFDDAVTVAQRKATDKLAPLRKVTDIFTENCRTNYNASSAGTIDEQLVTFRGHCSFKVCMPQKSRKYGMKLWTLCDSSTFYCCNFQVYLGKKESMAEKQEDQCFVKELSTFWNGSARTITANNFLTDISLAEDLLKNNIFFVGTMRHNRKNLPKAPTDSHTKQEYSSLCLFTENLTLIPYAPKPRKSVILFSSRHHQHSIFSTEDNYKAEVIPYYNATKSSVDTFDKLIREYSCRRYTRRWPLSLFLSYLDVAAYNALVLWLIKFPTWKNSVNIRNRRKAFLEHLSIELFANIIERRATAIENGELSVQRHVAAAIESTGRKIQVNLKNEADSRKRARCCICIGNDSKYSMRCNACGKFLCKVHSKTTILCMYCAD